MRIKVTTIAVLLVFFLTPMALFAQKTILSEDFSPAPTLPENHGDWTVKNGELFQNSTKNSMAKLNLKAEQSGVMQYEFTVKYAGGGEDRMGGFGIHIFVNNPDFDRSWGNGSSYLLWINYDDDATYGGKGFRAQVYDSDSTTEMILKAGYSLAPYAQYLSIENLNKEIPIKIVANSYTGEINVYDPSRPKWYYYFTLPNLPEKATHIAFRTNSLAVSIDDLKVTKLR